MIELLSKSSLKLHWERTEWCEQCEDQGKGAFQTEEELVFKEAPVSKSMSEKGACEEVTQIRLDSALEAR